MIGNRFGLCLNELEKMLFPSEKKIANYPSKLSALFKKATSHYLTLQRNKEITLDQITQYETCELRATLELRNHRVITDSKTIQGKLEKQFRVAQLHKALQIPNNPSDPNDLPFEYLTFDPNDFKSSTGFTSQRAGSLQISGTVTCDVEVAQLLGSKISQEDRHVAASFQVSSPDGKDHTVLLTGVFDGHAGAASAAFMKNTLQRKIRSTFSYLFSKKLPIGHPLKKLENEKRLSDKVVWNVLKIVCVQLHEQYVQKHSWAGTTAAFSLLIDGEDLWHANIGDSRSVITSDENTVQLSEDQTFRFSFPKKTTKEKFEKTQEDFLLSYLRELPSDEFKSLEKEIKTLQSNICSLKEQSCGTHARKSSLSERIKALEQSLDSKEKKLKKSTNLVPSAWHNSYERTVWKRNGFVDRRELRLNGALGPARAIGDLVVGEAVCPRPKITKVSLSKEFCKSDFCFLLHASDGLWDSATTDEVAEGINKNATKPLAEIAKDLAYSSVKAMLWDNVTTILTKIDLRALREVKKTSRNDA